MSEFSILLVICAVVLSAEALKLPDYIKPCSRKDPKFNECALQHGKEAIPRLITGDPKYGVPVLDPLLVKELMVEQSGFKLITRDLYVEGAKGAILKDFSTDFDKLTISIEALLPVAVFRGKYEISGKLASLPIAGNGNFKNSLEDLNLKYTTSYNFTKKDDGKLYITPYDYKLDFNPKKLIINFENLFNGNKLLGDTMNAFLTENWRLVLEDIGQPAYKSLGLVVHEILKGVSQRVPYDELFSDTN